MYFLQIIDIGDDMSSFSIEDLKSKFVNIYDIRYKAIKCNEDVVTLVYLDSLHSRKMMSEFIIVPLTNYEDEIIDSDQVIKEIIQTASAIVIEGLDEALELILRGDVLIFLNPLVMLFVVMLKDIA